MLVPGYKRIIGNEKADSLAKEETNTPFPDPNISEDFPYRYFDDGN